jgi:plastocyanin
MKSAAFTTYLVLFVLVAAPSLRPQTAPAVTETKEVQITAKKYEFSPNTVEVKAGTIDARLAGNLELKILGLKPDV